MPFCNKIAQLRSFFWWAVRDSNPHSSGYEKASLVKISKLPQNFVGIPQIRTTDFR